MNELLYNEFYGRQILSKYIPKTDRKYVHSVNVAKFAKRVAERIKHKNREIDLDTQLVEFLGLVHDIGNSVNYKMHELHTIDLLINNEHIPEDIAWMTIHGQIPEQYGWKFGNPKKYYPKKLEGIILMYADMSVFHDHPISMDERIEDIIERAGLLQNVPEDYRNGIITGILKAEPRFKRYEKIIFELAGVWKYQHFGVRKKRINKGSKHSRRKKHKTTESKDL